VASRNEAGSRCTTRTGTVPGCRRPRAAGPPVAGGPWEVACLLVRHYEFAEPRIVRAVYRGHDELLGRDMLLEDRFAGLRFYLGCGSPR